MGYRIVEIKTYRVISDTRQDGFNWSGEKFKSVEQAQDFIDQIEMQEKLERLKEKQYWAKGGQHEKDWRPDDDQPF